MFLGIFLSYIFKVNCDNNSLVCVLKKNWWVVMNDKEKRMIFCDKFFDINDIGEI